MHDDKPKPPEAARGARLLGFAKKDRSIRVWRLASGRLRYERTKPPATPKPPPTE